MQVVMLDLAELGAGFLQLTQLSRNGKRIRKECGDKRRRE